MAGQDETDISRAELIRIDPAAPAGGDRIALGQMTTIGRNMSNTVTLEDDVVSRDHALIRREGGSYVVVDLGSANGTFVNNRPISSPVILQNNDELRIGDAVFIVRYTGESETTASGDPEKSTRRFFAEVHVAVLVSDIRNYTSLSEHIAADRLSALLSDWFRLAGRCIERHTGIIEKFRGDSLMAYWMASKSAGATHVSQAIEAARELVSASRDFNERFTEHYPDSAFKIGCGIHVGDAVLGNIGADARRDFTTLGDCVNVTFRIESLCSSLNREILVSEDARRLVTADLSFDDAGLHALKGKAEAIRLFSL